MTIIGRVVQHCVDRCLITATGHGRWVISMQYAVQYPTRRGATLMSRAVVAFAVRLWLLRNMVFGRAVF